MTTQANQSEQAGSAARLALARAELEAAIWRRWTTRCAFQAEDVDAILLAADTYADAVVEQCSGRARLTVAADEVKLWREQSRRWRR